MPHASLLVSGAPFVMARCFSRGSYVGLVERFPARLIDRYFAPLVRSCYVVLVGASLGGFVVAVGRRMRWGGGPAVRGGASAQPRSAAQPLI